MTYDITELENNITKITIDFSDENIKLQGETTVKGTAKDAEKYVSTFARDLKKNNIELFPPPTEPEHPDIDEELM